jgi:hypothetical protein
MEADKGKITLGKPAAEAVWIRPEKNLNLI